MMPNVRYQILCFPFIKEMLKAIPDGDACLEWPRSRTKQGYGKVYADGKHRRVHCVAYELTKGPIPSGIKVCHTCDNPPCFRPSHLFLGSAKQNTQDCVRKGRMNSPRGEARKKKLKDYQVIEMRRLREEGWSQKALAERFSVKPGMVSRIVNRIYWTHI